MAERAEGPRRGWLANAVMASCLALELVVASSAGDAPLRVAALAGLAAVAVALALRQALSGLAASRALRAAVVTPVVFSILVIVVLVLDAHARGGAPPR